MSLTTASPLSQTGLIPRIYRRADFSHRATPETLPRSNPPIRKAKATEESLSRRTHGRLGKAKHLQKAEFLIERSLSESVVVTVRFPFELHAAESHPNPLVKRLEKPHAGREVRGEIVRRASNHSVQSLNHSGVQIMTLTGQLPNLRLEFLQGLCSHRS